MILPFFSNFVASHTALILKFIRGLRCGLMNETKNKTCVGSRVFLYALAVHTHFKHTNFREDLMYGTEILFFCSF